MTTKADLRLEGKDARKAGEKDIEVLRMVREAGLELEVYGIMYDRCIGKVEFDEKIAFGEAGGDRCVVAYRREDSNLREEL